MKKVTIKLIGDDLDLSFCVSPEVARRLIPQLAEAALNPEGGSASMPVLPIQEEQMEHVSAPYRSLARFLATQQVSPLTLSFAEIEQKLGHDLRPSARQHKAWWANTTSHVQATAWMQMGYKTSNIQLEQERITFIRQ